MYADLTEQELVVNLLKGGQFDRDRHGGLFDRGGADSYYNRGPSPHWYPAGSNRGERVVNLTIEEIKEYMAGYDHNEAMGDKKDWN